MSWSISLIGKPENVVAALEAESGKLTGQCKIEYDDAKPHLVGLVKQNFANAGGYVCPLIKIEACGSGSARSVDGNAEQVQRSCSVKIDPFYSSLV